jgi:hypothetical protein
MLILDWKRNKFKARRKMSNSSEPGKEAWNQDNLANSAITSFSSRQSRKKRRFMTVKSQGAQTLLGRLNLTRRRIRLARGRLRVGSQKKPVWVSQGRGHPGTANSNQPPKSAQLPRRRPQPAISRGRVFREGFGIFW